MWLIAILMRPRHGRSRYESAEKLKGQYTAQDFKDLLREQRKLSILAHATRNLTLWCFLLFKVFVKQTIS